MRLVSENGGIFNFEDNLECWSDLVPDDEEWRCFNEVVFEWENWNLEEVNPEFYEWLHREANKVLAQNGCNYTFDDCDHNYEVFKLEFKRGKISRCVFLFDEMEEVKFRCLLTDKDDRYYKEWYYGGRIGVYPEFDYHEKEILEHMRRYGLFGIEWIYDSDDIEELYYHIDYMQKNHNGKSLKELYQTGKIQQINDATILYM
ncbi:hypothetical protein P261_00443 [Lachnospiraceae bacterium TWA4]|nr:hypothetical protein P261_00443 [Lachnospiraceae bacterium TWA4]